ncbi:MAG: DEAD/DEAH box helicase [Planctomycetes bacterium]|nr:DEAD/DEAH box helicase [Planctomycetota bacterium]MCB9826554.1 DEAD/DEAH box helicase [Planctomycetota bacterium]MCB9830672.1 DEAD/DEAH box helicase [Planctomycetota bacterium]MCB9899760.1 DEAD/DEAH box helicase [Planctomycetota bacterium]
MDEPADLRFADLGLSPELLKAVDELGYETPSAIQAQAIPPLLAGRDLIGQAQTGTGKTAAFALPLLQRLDMSRRDVQAIVLTPTRELAMQVAEAVRAYGKHVGPHGVRVLPVYGGQPIHLQRKALQGTVHVVIGTPGRVVDHLERGTLNLAGVHFFCLDEADEMLNMGFLEDVEWILEHAKSDRQIALFSATMPPPIRRVADSQLHDPVDVQIRHATRTVERIEQASIRVARHEKAEALERLLGVEDHEAVLVFVGTQRGATELAEHLQAHGFGADCIHGGMNQAQRDAVVKRLRARNIQIVVGTDVAARGLDIDHIGLVVNYDLPRDPEVYVHRVGRTGRAGRAGRAISLWQPRELHLLRSIERFSGQPMEPMRLPGIEELLARRRERLAEQLLTLQAEDLGEFVAWAQELIAANDVDAETLAAAALRLAWGEGPLHAPESAAAPDTGDAQGGPIDYVEIVVPVGARDRIRPGAIVGAIAGETGLPGKIVGRINMRDSVTFVQVPRQHLQLILERLADVRIGGRLVRARLAHPEGGDGRPAGRPQRGPRGPRGPRAPGRPHRKGPRRS